MFHEIKNIQLYDEIVNQIKTEIENGNLKKGEKLPSELELSKKFKVSRSTIREALTILRVEGIVETKKGVGKIILRLKKKFSKINEDFFNYLVNKYNLITNKKNLLEKYLDLLQIRKILEPIIYEEIATNSSKELIKELKKCILASKKRIKENLPYTVELTEFHYITYKYIKNTILKEFMMLTFEMQRLYRDFSLEFEITKESSLKEHEKIYYSILNNDPKTAKILIKTHLERTEKLLLNYLHKISNS